MQPLPLCLLRHHPHEGDHSGGRGAGEDREAQPGNEASKEKRDLTLPKHGSSAPIWAAGDPPCLQRLKADVPSSPGGSGRQ